MKALTIRQPWAWAIICAGKDVENRSWRTHYRGPLLIHAGSAYWGDPFVVRGVRFPEREELTFGAILGVVDLVDCVEKSRSRWFQPGAYGFVLENPRRLREPLPCSGRLGLWIPTARQARFVRENLMRRSRRA